MSRQVSPFQDSLAGMGGWLWVGMERAGGMASTTPLIEIAHNVLSRHKVAHVKFNHTIRKVIVMW